MKCPMANHPDAGEHKVQEETNTAVAGALTTRKLKRNGSKISNKNKLLKMSIKD